jgi:hypothetical protein
MSCCGGHLAGMFLGWSSTKFLFFVPVGYSTWLPWPIICSDWLKFQRSSSLKLMNWLNPNCKCVSRTIQWTFMYSFNQALIIFVVSEKKAFENFPIGFNVNLCEYVLDFIVHWVLPLLCLFGLINFETIQYALCHRKFSYMINQKFMKLCTLQDPNMKMCFNKWRLTGNFENEIPKSDSGNDYFRFCR